MKVSALFPPRNLLEYLVSTPTEVKPLIYESTVKHWTTDKDGDVVCLVSLDVGPVPDVEDEARDRHGVEPTVGKPRPSSVSILTATLSSFEPNIFRPRLGLRS